LKKAFEEHYRALKFLEHFRTVNKTAVVHLIHKYEDYTGIHTNKDEQITSTTTFCPNERLTSMIIDVEKRLMNALFKEDRIELNKLVRYSFMSFTTL
jgi:hypothetical protein